MGWGDLDNGELLDAMNGLFDALVTVDKRLPEQQHITDRALGVVVLRAKSNRLSDLLPWGRQPGPCSSCVATCATSWQSTSVSRAAGACRNRECKRTIRLAGTQRPSDRRNRRLKLTVTRRSRPGRRQSAAQRAIGASH